MSGIIVSVIGIISTVGGFVLLIREDRNLYGFVILLSGLVIVLASLFYVVFSKYPPQISGGKGTYRFYRSRIYAVLGIGIICGFLLAFALLKTNREYIVTALMGTATYTLSPTMTASNTPQPPESTITPTLTETQTLTNTPEPSATSRPSETLSPTSEIIFKDDFLNPNEHGWLVATSAEGNSEPKIESRVVSGKYKHTIYCPLAYSQCETLFSIPGVSEENFRLVFDVDIEQDTQYTDFVLAISFRARGGRYYIFQVNDAGEYTARLVMGSQIETLKSTTYSHLINLDSGTSNKFTIIADGPFLSFLINDHLFAEIEDGSLPQGGEINFVIKVFSGGSATLEFDNVEVVRLP